MSLDRCGCGRIVDTDCDDEAYYLDDEKLDRCMCVSCREERALPVLLSESV